MPRDITKTRLKEAGTGKAFRGRAGGAPRKDVESGKLRLVQAGDGSVHAIEAEYLAPEVHGLMEIKRPIVRAKELNRVVLLVNETMVFLRGTWVYKYLQYCEQSTFTTKKAKAVPIPQRPTCRVRFPWYDLTKLVKPGFAFWPMAQQYRHIIAGNPERLVCNHNLFDLHSAQLNQREQDALWAILNSTLVGLFKTFYGRFAGTEGNLKTEVVDVNLLEVPDPRGIKAGLANKLANAVDAMCQRTVGRLVEEQLMDCHSPQRARRIAAGPLVLSEELCQEDRRTLDDAVFELLGVKDPAERTQLVRRLHEDTARHFRAIRVIEIEKMEQRARTGSRRFSVQELAADAWDAAELPDLTPLVEWIGKRPEGTCAVNIPEERPAEMSPSLMFEPNMVYFGKAKGEGKPTAHVDCASKGQAKLLVYLANLGIAGWVKIPAKDVPCTATLAAVQARMEAARQRFEELAGSRTSDPGLQAQMVNQLLRWFLLGRSQKKPSAPPAGDDDDS